MKKFTLFLLVFSFISLGININSATAAHFPDKVKKYKTPSFTVISPNGGEVWLAGSEQTIEWRSDNIHSEYILVQFFKGSNSVYDFYTSNTGTAKIIVPENIGTGDDFKITIGYKNPTGPYAGVFFSDSSDSYFEITSQNSKNPSL